MATLTTLAHMCHDSAPCHLGNSDHDFQHCEAIVAVSLLGAKLPQKAPPHCNSGIIGIE